MNAPLSFHVGQAGFGTALDAPPTLDETLAQAGLDWEVSLRPTFVGVGGQQVKTTHKAVVRNDTEAILGVVGPRYHAVQNKAAFKAFEPFIESGAITMESAGSLSGGQRLWMLGKINIDPADVVKDDPVFNYVLLSNSHDGSLALRLGFTNVRVVCCNMLHAGSAHNQKNSKLLRIRHTASAGEALEKIGETLNLAKRNFEATVSQYQAMAARGVRTGDLERFVQRVFKPEIVEGGRWEDVRQDFHSVAVKNLVEKIEPLMEDETNTLPGVKGTVWSMYNAVTHFLTHERGRNENSRVNSLFFGDSATANARALSEGVRLAAA
jgi:phage/plasmid-like protein (TIGR03299 family)